MDIYVGNVPWSSTEEEVEKLFSSYGIIESVKILMDKETGRSRGVAFVVMPSDKEAEMAMAGLDGSDLGGRNIKVNKARPKKQYDKTF